jgi:hypothetical protein
MQKYSKLLRTAEKFRQRAAGSSRRSLNDTKVRQLEKDFRRLHRMFTEILVAESFFPDRPEKKAEKLTYDSNVTCSYCRCNIFNRFLTCPSCIGELGNGEEDTYDVCMECYAMGRSCACISKLRWVEQWSWGELTQKHEQWRHQILQYEGGITDKSPVSLKAELDLLGKKRTLAQICQLELARRPFRDVRRPSSPVTGDDRVEEEVVDRDGNVKVRKKIVRSAKFIREHARCHIDMHWEPKWKQASCSTCDKNYCYGVLFRAYDIMPQDILADPNWQCPSCRDICGCRTCRKNPGYHPYHPSGTVLGHDTKAVADPRSVESLVDFSYSNIGWIQKAGDDNGDDTRRLKKRQREADAAKASNPELGEHYVDGDVERVDDEVEDGILRLAEHEGIPVDPALQAAGVSLDLSPEEEDEFDENPEGVKRRGDSTPADGGLSQFAVPEGGIIRDFGRAYDPTEAITYDYPDPEIGRHLAAPVEDEAAALPPGYVSATAEDTGGIEMVGKKRKRTTVDEGDRPYGYKKPNPDKAKKKRMSLIVKLPISGEKLAGLTSMASIARQALNGGVDVPAPVISSDIQALNAAADNPQQVPKRIRGVEHVVVDRDDDFTPGRYRDRRKGAPDGAPLPAPDADITRRQTRMQNVRYEEPSEEDFNEVAPDEPSGRPSRTRKTVRLDDVDDDLDGESAASDAVAGGEDESASSPPPVEMAVDPALRAKERPAAIGPVTVSHQTRSERSERAASISSAGNPPTTDRPTTSGKGPARAPLLTTTALEEAQANRRAKMAAIEGLDNDDADSVSWSSHSFFDEPTVAAAPPPSFTPVNLTTRPAARGAHDGSPSPAPVPAVAKVRVSAAPRSEHHSTTPSAEPPVVPKVAKMKAAAKLAAPRSEHHSTTPSAEPPVVPKVAKVKVSAAPRSDHHSTTPSAEPPAVPKVAKVKVSAAAWVDSDDSDDGPAAAAKPKTSLGHVDGGGSAHRRGSTPRGRGSGPSAGRRRRGRPAYKHI